MRNWAARLSASLAAANHHAPVSPIGVVTAVIGIGRSVIGVGKHAKVAVSPTITAVMMRSRPTVIIRSGSTVADACRAATKIARNAVITTSKTRRTSETRGSSSTSGAGARKAAEARMRKSTGAGMGKTAKARRRSSKARRGASEGRRRGRRTERKCGSCRDCCGAEHCTCGHNNQRLAQGHAPARSGTILLHRGAILDRIVDGIASHSSLPFLRSATADESARRAWPSCSMFVLGHSAGCTWLVAVTVDFLCVFSRSV
jgi:hypothetical protein